MAWRRTDETRPLNCLASRKDCQNRISTQMLATTVTEIATTPNVSSDMSGKIATNATRRTVE
jgi:hypothetical protein